MNTQTNSDRLVRYAFIWSLVRLVIAAVSLFFGAMPAVYRVLGSGGLGGSLLQLSWIVSGLATIYLLYAWYKGGYKLFGKSGNTPKILFLVLIVTGLNLGLATTGNNIGMGLIGGFAFAGVLYKLTALLYLYVVYTLWNGWKANGEQLFVGGGSLESSSEKSTSEATTDTETSTPETQTSSIDTQPSESQASTQEDTEEKKG